MIGVAGPTVSVLEDEGFPEDVMRVRSISVGALGRVGMVDYYPGPACSVTEAPLIPLYRVGRIVGDARGSVKHNRRAGSMVL